MKNRIKYCIANFKMNLGTQSDLMNYFTVLNNCKITDNSKIKTIIAPPFTVLNQAIVLSEVSSKNIEIGAQNINDNEYGAFTGEISVEMLKDCGINYVIVGHSERRFYFHETNEEVNKKLNLAINNDLSPIFCIGETLEEREGDLTEQILKKQLTKGLSNIKSNNIIIAYEPVWAIGTGKTATSDMILKTHMLIRNILNDIGFDGEKISILYGGSVNRNNAEESIKLKGVDGFLIGGASLNAKHFYDIYKFIEESI